jgi:hypothetical protein
MNRIVVAGLSSTSGTPMSTPLSPPA